MILRDYAGAFVSIIGGAYRRYLRAGSDAAPVAPFVYLDGFAGTGRYDRDSDGSRPNAPIWGSPIIGMQAFEQAAAPVRNGGVSVPLSGLFVEENDEHFDRLVENVAAAGLATPHRVLTRIGDAQHGQINLIRADFRDLFPDVVHWLERRYTLALVDPYGAAMPMDSLGQLLARDRTDAIVLFPFMDVDRKGVSIRKAFEDQTPGDRGNITRVAAVFGDSSWERIARDTSLNVEQRESEYEDLYFNKLQGLDPALVVKNIPLRLSAAARTVYHLFLATRDPDGALRMNSILRSAGLGEHFALWGDYFERRRRRDASRGYDGDLFGGALDVAPEVQPTTIDKEDVKRAIKGKCPSGTSITVKELRRRMANEIYTEGEISSALTALKGEGAATYSSARKVDDRISFT